MESMLTIIFEGCLFAIAAGLVYGIFGGGSGLFLMPGFYLLLHHFPVTQGHEMQVAVTTTAATSVLLGIFPTRIQFKQGHFDITLGKTLVWGLLLGVILAVVLLNFIPSGFLKRLFGVVVILVAFWFWFYRQDKDERSWSFSPFINGCMTFIIGLFWFLLGVGVFLVPFLHKSGVDMRRAVGTATFFSTMLSGLAAVLLMIVGGFRFGASWTHIGFLNVTLLLIAVVPSAISAYFGAKISIRIPQHYLRKVYACLICVVGVIMILP